MNMSALQSAGLDYEPVVAMHLMSLPCVYSVEWFAKGDRWMDRPSRPDFMVTVEGGTKVAVDAKCDPRDKGNVYVRQRHFDSYAEWAARSGAVDALICAGSPVVGTHHGFTEAITGTPAAFLDWVQSGRAWNIAYGGEPSIEDLLKGFVK